MDQRNQRNFRRMTLTDKEVKRMRELKAQGLPISKIAKKFVILPESCKYRLDPDSRKEKIEESLRLLDKLETNFCF